MPLTVNANNQFHQRVRNNSVSPSTYPARHQPNHKANVPPVHRSKSDSPGQHRSRQVSINQLDSDVDKTSVTGDIESADRDPWQTVQSQKQKASKHMSPAAAQNLQTPAHRNQLGSHRSHKTYNSHHNSKSKRF